MLLIGIIVDPQQGAATRLIEDLGTLLSLEPALAPVEVVLLENPGETPASPTDAGSFQKLARRSGISLHWKSLDEQRSDAARGLFGNLTLSSGRQPIATARTMLQRYVSQYNASQGLQRDPASAAGGWVTRVGTTGSGGLGRTPEVLGGPPTGTAPEPATRPTPATPRT